MKLFELAQSYRVIEERYENGEFELEQVKDTLDAIDDEFNPKAENIANWIGQNKAEIERLKEKKKAFADEQKRLEKLNASLKDYLAQSLEAKGVKKFYTENNILSVRKAKSVQIDDEHLIPDEFFNIKETRTVSKDAIGKALKAGKQVQGAELIEKASLTIK